MSKVKKGIILFFQIFGILMLIAVLAGAGCWVVQPTLPDTALDVGEEFLASDEYRAAADSALEYISSISEDMKLPSVSVAVGIDSGLVWAVTLGMADIRENRPSQLNTLYRAGSIAKSMTGLVAAQLVQNGKLDLDAPVEQYLPDYPEKQWEFSVRQLADHTAGIRHYTRAGRPGFWKERFSKKRYSSVQDALEIFIDDPLLFEPGTDFQYSTHGFTLLSAVLEQAASRPYLTLIEELVLNPAGMQNTRPDDIAMKDPDRAIPYTRMCGRYVHLEGPDPSYKLASGGFLTTPTDLVRLGGAFLTGRIADSLWEETLFDPRPLADGTPNPQGYALGWRNAAAVGILGTPDTVAVRHHGGATPGGSSFLLLVPDGKVAAASMTNLSVANNSELRLTLYRIAGLFRKTTLGD